VKPASTEAPHPALLAQGTVPDVLDPLVPEVTTMDRGAEMTDGAISSDDTTPPRK